MKERIRTIFSKVLAWSIVICMFLAFLILSGIFLEMDYWPGIMMLWLFLFTYILHQERGNSNETIKIASFFIIIIAIGVLIEFIF